MERFFGFLDPFLNKAHLFPPPNNTEYCSGGSVVCNFVVPYFL